MGDTTRCQPKLCPPNPLTRVRPSVSLKERDAQQSQLTLLRLNSRLGRPPEAHCSAQEAFGVTALGDKDGASLVGSVSATQPHEDSRSRMRQVEHGVLHTPSRIAVQLRFEGFPIWLMALDSTMTNSVAINGSSCREVFLASMQDQGFDRGLFEAALDNVGADKVEYTMSTSLSPGTLLLVSGSIAFVKGWRLEDPNPTLVICTEHVRSKHMHGERSLRWSRFRHETFGGVTQFQAMVGSNIQDFNPCRTELRRTLRHVVDYGLKPKWAPAPSLGKPSSELSLNDRLHPSDLGRSILYHTHYSATGWGIRQLSVDEIGIAFGWPAWARAFTMTLGPFFPSIPVQILDGCLQGILKSTPRHDPLQTPMPQPGALVASSTWLPGIQKFLPHSWIDPDLITDKAAKRDDAGVPVHLWDKRCTLVLPHVTPALDTLRFWLTRGLTTRLWREFHAYLCEVHGEDWRVSLRQAKTFVAQGRFSAGKRTRGGVKKANNAFAYEELVRDVTAGVDAISRVSDSDWWTWKNGSALLFWRWPEGEQRQSARDGMPIWIKSKLPRFQGPARPPDPAKKHLILAKLKKILDRGYVVTPDSVDFIKSLMDFFDVEKDSDIRLVYNGTSCGLNEALWAPNFFLPTPATAARTLGYGYYMVDIDLGEMFLNFPLHESLQRFSGVDFTQYASELREGSCKRWWVHWTRCWMGLKPSPFMAVRFYYLAEEFVRGNRRDKNNALRWDYVKFNLPGDPKFDITQPRVMKWDSSIGKIAGDIVAFVDDLRASGHSVEQTWAIGKQTVSRLQYLGLQDAPRKRKPPVRASGPWAGSVFTTTDTEVLQSVSQSKWDRTKALLTELILMLSSSPSNLLNYKRLEEIRGFLGHISMTYTMVTPYLKGLHLTLASHNPGRDKFGWKIPSREWAAYLHEALENGKLSKEEAELLGRASEEPVDYEMEDEDVYTPPPPNIYKPPPPPPKSIAAVPRLQKDVESMQRLFEQDIPAQVLLRASRVYTIIYGFADASGSGFGSTIMLNGEIEYRIGTWGSDTEDESSNYREFENVVDALREEEKKGNLINAFIFMGTDNSTVECAIVKGNSSSEKLYELALEVRVIEMRNNAKVMVSHISGDRMRAQGTDGVSRGQLKEGVSAGKSMLSFIPLHLDAIERSPAVEPWLKSWLGEDAEVLTPEGWFERGHDLLGGKYDAKGFWRHSTKKGTFIWNPPPAAASVAIEELRKARIKRQDSMHVFICPRLMKPEWFRQLYKAADIVFDVPVGTACWPSSMFEPLIIGIAFPFIRAPPWQLRSTPKMFKLGWQLRRVWAGEEMDSGNLLREFLLEYQRIRSMPPDVVRRVLFFESRCPIPRQGPGGRRARKRKRPHATTEDEVSLGKETQEGRRLPSRPRR
jgi:hypothetical protein